MNLNPLEVKKRLLQKAPFQMVDKVEDLIDGKSCVGIKVVSSNDPFFNGHFPKAPIMPGVMVIEAAAQTCSIILEGAPQEGYVPALVTVDEFKLLKPIVPGDVMKIYCNANDKSGRHVYIFDVSIKVNNTLCAKGKLTFMYMNIDDVYKEK